MADLWHTILLVAVFFAYRMGDLEPTLDPQQSLGSQGLQLGVLAGPESGEGGQDGDEMLEVAESLAVQLRGDLLGHLAIAEGIVDVIGGAGGGGIDLDPDVEDDGLDFVFSAPGIGTDDGGDVEVAQVDGVELRRVDGSHGRRGFHRVSRIARDRARRVPWEKSRNAAASRFRAWSESGRCSLTACRTDPKRETRETRARDVAGGVSDRKIVRRSRQQQLRERSGWRHGLC